MTNLDHSRDRVMDRVKKLMALANNEAATPAEAANALRKAHAWMRKHDITEADMLAAQIREDSIEAGQRIPAWRKDLVQVINRAFGTYSLYVKRLGKGHRTSIRFMGPDLAVEISIYAYQTLVRQCVRAKEYHLLRFDDTLSVKQRAGRAFCEGWVLGVAEVVTGFADDTPYNRHTSQALDAYLIKTYPDIKQAGFDLVGFDDGMAEHGYKGFKEGKEANLHAPVRDGRRTDPMLELRQQALEKLS